MPIWIRISCAALCRITVQDSKGKPMVLVMRDPASNTCKPVGGAHRIQGEEMAQLLHLGAEGFEDMAPDGSSDMRFRLRLDALDAFRRWYQALTSRPDFPLIFNPLRELLEELGRESGLVPEFPQSDAAIRQLLAGTKVENRGISLSTGTHVIHARFLKQIEEEPRTSGRGGQEELTTYGFQDVYEVSLTGPDLPEKIRTAQCFVLLRDSVGYVVQESPPR